MYGELVPMNRPGTPETIPLMKKDLLLGRHPSCDIVVPNRGVSRNHCELIFNQDGHWTVRDLNSRHGTKVNGTTIEKTQLNPGDIITIANCDYEIQYAPTVLTTDGPDSESDIKTASDIMKWAYKQQEKQQEGQAEST